MSEPTGLPPEIRALILDQFPGDDWAGVRQIIADAADRSTTPLRIGFDTPLYREIKPRLRLIQDAMIAAGMFDFPRVYLVREIEAFRRDQDRLARSCRAAGLGDDEPAGPELPEALTVRLLGERAYPTLAPQVHTAMRRHGWRTDGRGCWIEPKRLKERSPD